jgi:hypothetical protein
MRDEDATLYSGRILNREPTLLNDILSMAFRMFLLYILQMTREAAEHDVRLSTGIFSPAMQRSQKMGHPDIHQRNTTFYIYPAVHERAMS